MRRLKPLGALMRKEWWVLLRDWQGLVVLFLMPAAFILIMSLATQDSFQQRKATATVVLVADGDRQSPASRRVIRELDNAPSFEVRLLEPPPDRAALKQRILDNEAVIALYLPAGLERTLRALEPGEAVAKLDVYLAPSVLPHIRGALLSGLESMLRGLRGEYMYRDHLLMEIEAQLGVSLEQMVPRQAEHNPVPLVEHYAYREAAPRDVPTSVQQSVPAWLVFAMFFVVIPLSTALIIEREQGSLRRLRLLNISSLTLLSARILPYYLINLVQMVIMLAVGAYLVPLLGGDRLLIGDQWFGLWLIGSATSLAAIGFALLIATLARTHMQATTVGGVANVVLGAVGGIMVPKVVMSPAMREFARISPMSWSLEGFWDVLLRRGDWLDVLPECAALLAFGGLCLLAGAWLFHRQTG
ncbi:ABC transporter permease [Alkalilimnicola sp. S0819]|uniref:ABC transporter permease n=1 Tax=Alkalilimnicola sp. S0819 TaxID=2613922 RepID=UPI001261F9C0|nr:ABC transporter permease [Alkalilimnicola sp. S0819]KAB7624173.1 ABC transporter permease [Alkalilimnicola sp. S0819]MPQ16426.1 ABC transporter permease subunit [Alkalilimnicola sp. S0819]